MYNILYEIQAMTKAGLRLGIEPSFRPRDRFALDVATAPAGRILLTDNPTADSVERLMGPRRRWRYDEQ